MHVQERGREEEAKQEAMKKMKSAPVMEEAGAWDMAKGSYRPGFLQGKS